MPNESASSTGGQMRLIEATLSCLASDGLAGATVRRIAERAGVTPGLVRHHFAGKDVLLAEAYRTLSDSWLARVKESVDRDYPDRESALRGALTAFFPDNVRDIRQMRITVTLWGLILVDPDISEIQKASYTALQACFETLIERHFGARKDARQIAIGIISIADGLWLECCLNPDRMAAADAIETALRFAMARLTAGAGNRSTDEESGVLP